MSMSARIIISGCDDETSPGLKYTTSLISDTVELDWDAKDFRSIVGISKSSSSKDDSLMKNLRIFFNSGKKIGIPAKWKLCLEMDKKKEQLEVWLTLETKPKEVKTIFAKWEVEIRKADSSDQVYEQRAGAHGFEVGTVWGWDNFANLDNLLTSWRNILSSDGTLRLHIRLIQYTRGVKVTEAAPSVDVMQRDSFSKIAEDGLALLESRTFTDFKVKAGDGKSFDVHKAVLGARSPVFLTMLESGMSESTSGTLVVEDISGDAMEELLKHIYSGVLDETITGKEFFPELVNASEKYDLIPLKNFCDKKLIETANVENALELFDLAVLHKLPTAIKDIQLFISENLGVAALLEARQQQVTVANTPRPESRTSSSSEPIQV